jgi:hypothetical protein
MIYGKLDRFPLVMVNYYTTTRDAAKALGVSVRTRCEMESFQQLAIVVISALASEEIDAHGSLPARVEQMGKPVDFKRLQEIALSLWASRVAALV